MSQEQGVIYVLMSHMTITGQLQVRADPAAYAAPRIERVEPQTLIRAVGKIVAAMATGANAFVTCPHERPREFG
jgi:hypothetical protein